MKLQFLTEEQLKVVTLDHHGLVAGVMHDIGFIDKIDKMMPIHKEKGAILTHGQRIAGMVLNGMGFLNNRLYIFPNFFQELPVERLLGEGICADQFNDDSLGRCLDAIFDYGTTKFFTSLSFKIGLEQGLIGDSFNFDTTSLSLSGMYDEAENVLAEMVSKLAAQKEASQQNEAKVSQTEPVKFESSATQSQKKPPKQDRPERATASRVAPELHNHPIPNYGHSKDFRPDLKQMIMTLATTGAAGFPIWMEAHNGNASDKTILHEGIERMLKLIDHMKESFEDKNFLMIADSALFDALMKHGLSFLWLTRVPENHLAAKEFLTKADENFTWTELGEGYKIHAFEHVYDGIKQRWGLVSSAQAYAREVKTLDRNIGKQEKEVEKALNKLIRQEFLTEDEAKKSINGFEKYLEKTYFKLKSSSLEPTMKHASKGRPKPGAVPACVGYIVVVETTRDEEKIEFKRRTKGRFILATNQLDKGALPDIQILPEYKSQSKVESNNKLFKDPDLQISSVFLKRTERISALMVVMGLCLMVYAIAQHKIRKNLQESNDTVPTQTKKETNNPTFKWIMKMFRGVSVVRQIIGDQSHEFVANLTETRRKIIEHFGARTMAIYGMKPRFSSG